MVFAFEEEDLGKLDEKIQPPYKIRTVLHQPWAEYSSRKPIKVRDEEAQFFKKKVDLGVMEPGAWTVL
jgi:hypothetical protein